MNDDLVSQQMIAMDVPGGGPLSASIVSSLKRDSKELKKKTATP